jgi:hypothetical protein
MNIALPKLQFPSFCNIFPFPLFLLLLLFNKYISDIKASYLSYADSVFHPSVSNIITFGLYLPSAATQKCIDFTTRVVISVRNICKSLLHVSEICSCKYGCVTW